MSKLKAGDLALVVAASCPENIGKVVELVRRHETDRAVIYGQEFITRRGAPAWHVAGDLVSLHDYSISYGFLSESCLMPLRSDFQPEQQKSQEVPA